MHGRCIDNQELRALASAVLGKGHEFRFQARGQSMLPFIKDGDTAIVQPIGNVPSTIRLGDVVLCVIDERRLLVHRVMGISKNDSITMYRIQGNAVAKADGLIASEQILGRVTGIERGSKQRQIDTPWERILGTLWIWASPLTRRSYRLVSRMFG